jgi:F0F1-type ATP synthase epsilon subunit
VVTPKGLAIEEHRLDEVVLKRREEGVEGGVGSEIAILRRHGPTLVRTAAAEVRYRRGDHVGRLQAGPGVAEIADETVTLLVPGVQRLSGIRS